MYKKILFFITWIVLSLSFFSISVHGFLWEDLWLDLYKSIDEGLEELEIKQYQYELSDQWQAGWGRIKEYVNSILSTNGIECEIESVWDIELIANATESQIQEVYKKCKPKNLEAAASKQTEDWGLSPIYIESIINEVRNVRTSLKQRAEEKSKIIYQIARIGLYSDGVEENSPFDLITDIEEIDRVIFSEEIEYIWEDYGSLDFSDELDDFVAGNDRIGNASYNREENNTEESNSWNTANPESEEDSIETETSETVGDIIETLDTEGNQIIATEDGHLYACYQDRDESWLDEVTLDWLSDNIYTSWGNLEALYPSIANNWSYESLADRDNRTRGRLWTPIVSGPLEAKARFWPESWYSQTFDSWECDNFFCITVWFVTGQQALFWAWGWWQTVSVESILTKAWDHLNHHTNTSLIQSKMTTNNFENNLIIPSLWDMLRWFGIQIQSKPVPILNLDNSEKENESWLKWDVFSRVNLLTTYYKNLWLDYSRANDLDIFERTIVEKQALQNSAELATTEATSKLNAYENFVNSLEKENKILSEAIDNKVINDDLEDFYTQFVELERLTLSIDDFALWIKWSGETMRKIPTQKP